MVSCQCVSVMTRLETLNLGSHSPRCQPGRASRRLPPMTRVDLPVLAHLWYKEPSEYLEDFVARTNASRHHSIEVMRSEEHTSELQSHSDLVCRLLLEKK